MIISVKRFPKVLRKLYSQGLKLCFEDSLSSDFADFMNIIESKADMLYADGSIAIYLLHDYHPCTNYCYADFVIIVFPKLKFVYGFVCDNDVNDNDIIKAARRLYFNVMMLHNRLMDKLMDVYIYTRYFKL